MSAQPSRRKPPRRPSEQRLRAGILTAGGRIPAEPPADVWRPWQNGALRSAADVETALAEIRRIGLVPHHDRPKNWDLLVALGTILERTTPDARVLEMGAARYSPLLVWLYQLGYRRLRGIDLVWPRRVRRGPITFDRADLTHTSFATGSFDAIACLSVIEHGVDVEAYLREARRLLRPGGLLVTSTDYWSAPVDVADRVAFGGPVRVFDRAAIESLLATARSLGFEVAGPADLSCGDRVVRWERMDLEFTFIVLTLVAPARAGPSRTAAAWVARARRAVGRRVRRLARAGQRRRSSGRRAVRNRPPGRRTPRNGSPDGRLAAATPAGDAAAIERALLEDVLREPTDGRRHALRQLAGRRVMLADDWLPRIPSPPLSTVPPGPADAVLWLVDGPPPDRAGAPGSRAHRLLAAGRAANLPLLALAPAPSRAGTPSRRDVDGVTYVAPPLDERHDGATPPDLALDHQAWFASWLARREGASAIHAVVRPGGRATALVALALRRHLGVPLVVEPLGAVTGPGATHSNDRVVTRLLGEADAVVVGSEADRRRLVHGAAGASPPVEHDRVVIVPDPLEEGGAAATVAALRHAYACARATRSAMNEAR